MMAQRWTSACRHVLPIFIPITFNGAGSADIWQSKMGYLVLVPRLLHSVNDLMVINDGKWSILMHCSFQISFQDLRFIFHLRWTFLPRTFKSLTNLFQAFSIHLNWQLIESDWNFTIITLVRFAFDQGVAFSFKFCLTLLSPGHFQLTFCNIREISHQNNELLLHTLPYRIITRSKSNWNELKQSKSTNNVKLELHPSDLSRNNFNFSMGWKSNCLLNRTKPYRVKYSIEWNDLW